jgi:hypothetical protein
LLGFDEFFEAVFQQLFILHVIRFVLFHIGLVLERVFAPATVKMCRALSVEYAMLHHALFRCPIAMETFLVYRRVLSVIV